MKRIVNLLIITSLIFTLIGIDFDMSIQVNAASSAGGVLPMENAGFISPISEPDPNAVVITTAEQLQNIKNDLNGNYVLGNDIDLSSYNNGVWIPLGTNMGTFRGTLDGAGYKIINLISDRGDTQYVGLFGIASDGAVIKNLGIENGDITNNNSYTGGIVCYMSDIKISNCYFKGRVSNNDSDNSRSNYVTGGIVGETAYDNTTIENCYFKGTISGIAITGGIVGSASAGISVINCYNSGVVNNSDGITGGVVGILYNATTMGKLPALEVG